MSQWTQALNTVGGQGHAEPLSILAADFVFSGVCHACPDSPWPCCRQSSSRMHFNEPLLIGSIQLDHLFLDWQVARTQPLPYLLWSQVSHFSMYIARWPFKEWA